MDLEKVIKHVVVRDKEEKIIAVIFNQIDRIWAVIDDDYKVCVNGLDMSLVLTKELINDRFGAKTD